MAAKIISRMHQFGCLGVPWPPGHLLRTRYYSKLWTTARGRHCFTWECASEKGSHGKPQVAKSRAEARVQATAQSIPTTDSVWAPAVLGYKAYSQHSIILCILPEGRIVTFQKRILTIGDPKTSLPGSLYKVSESRLQTSGQNLSMKTWAIGNIE